ncbi:PASTA domain-containing protein [Brucepastera parasyntrophica]|uniref:PASTA domain-containing protein n=1 Tax=Brucepastera parasyntrophica TaxID=2880008 RepID=UPI00210888B7|nr:PASTA domain-containing protein [Brucepastera parasyntrophica]ULQ59204.1 PASTA domain-containing protein [Brucepastera parasyntrophica]
MSFLKPDMDDLSRKLENNSKTIFLCGLVMFLVTAAACVIIFFISLKSSEQVMVPAVTGKDLSVAMLEMQAKELYPRIQLRYSDQPEDKGIILEQSPSAGSIVKAGRRINLVVSRGIIIDRVENFTGQNIDDVKMHLQALFTSMSVPLLTIKEPVLYQFSTEPAGTILEQNPPPDTPITGPMQMDMVVSRGPENNKTRVPDLTGLTVRRTLSVIKDSDIVFDFSSRNPEGNELAGTIVSQIPAGDSLVNTFSRVSVVIAFPVTATDGNVYGIFTETLPDYPYPFTIRLDAISPNGDRAELVSLKHPGGILTIPYVVPSGTVLALTILNREISTFEVRAPAVEDEMMD